VELLGVVAREDQKQTEQGLEDHGALGDPEGRPEAHGGPILHPGQPTPDPRDQVRGEQRDADYEMDFRHGRGSLGGGNVESRQKESGFLAS